MQPDYWPRFCPAVVCVQFIYFGLRHPGSVQMRMAQNWSSLIVYLYSHIQNLICLVKTNAKNCMGLFLQPMSMHTKRIYMHIRTMVTGAHANINGLWLALNVCRIKWRSKFDPVFNRQTQYRHNMLVLSKKLLHRFVSITLTFCQFHFSQRIKQPINPAIWTLSPLQEVVLTYTVGIKIWSSYWYVPAALTWYVIA